MGSDTTILDRRLLDTTIECECGRTHTVPTRQVTVEQAPAAPDLDACSAFALLTGADPVALEPDGLRRFEPQAELPLQGGTAYWLVAVDSTLAGLGDTGR